jgi:heme-degrading monooxygenase HmoA
MFSVIFEVNPRPEQWDAYLATARMLRPELEMVDGFVDNIRYRSLTRDGWLLSLSGWRDEKAVVRWRTRVRHHQAQADGRETILLDYHLRVGQIVRDTRVPDGHSLREQRLDETDVGAGSAITLIDFKAPPDTAAHGTIPERMGFNPSAEGCVDWDVFDAVLTPGDMIILACWRNQAAADAAMAALTSGDDIRLRHVRIIRDYAMFDRREAPQYYPDAKGRATLHA